MSHIDISDLTVSLPDGRLLLDAISLRVPPGTTAGLVGPNGAGKTTLLRLIAGQIQPDSGRVRCGGTVALMPQFIGTLRDRSTVRDLLLSVAPPRIRSSTQTLSRAEDSLAARNDEAAQLAYADALTEHIDSGAYDLEVVWDACTTRALGLPLAEVADRPVTTLSGGEQKALVIDAVLDGPDEILLLDEPDNYLDVPAKEWIEHRLRASRKTILLVSHDRQVLASAADRILTVEDRDAWLHHGSFTTYAQARHERLEHLDERRRRWENEHRRLRQMVHTLQHSPATHDAVQAGRTRLARFEDAGPPRRPPKPQNIRMRLSGGRTGKRAVICDQLALTGLTEPFDLEVWFGERLAVVGANGTGKTHFLSLLTHAAQPDNPIRHTGTVQLGARVVPGLFAQTHARPDLHDRTPAEIVMTDHSLERNDAMSALARYEIAPAWKQPFHTLSGGQQARLQILLLELAGATLLLLDEPTDNLDLASAEALQHGLRQFTGTVITVTHDRWFAAEFDHYLVFDATRTVNLSDAATWQSHRSID